MGRSNEIDYITLAAFDEGRPLYELLGFEADGNGDEASTRASAGRNVRFHKTLS